jgi:Asp-tRNA(Asn)/Glu-tRNA(Gln) amidotransferase A subunit family amidase
MYANGYGVPEDDAEAVRWYRMAAEQGSADAQSNLGVMYANGEGVVQDDARAYLWFNLAVAASQGDERARRVESRDRAAARLSPTDRAAGRAAARVLDVIAGYDPKDELTAFSVGRLPTDGYASHAEPGRLVGLRIGVVREYMDKEAFTKEDEETIDLVSAAAAELGRLGATLVDPGPGGALFDQCVRRWHPLLHDKQFTAEYPDRFPFEADGTPYGNHIATLIELAADPDLMPEEIDFRTLDNPPTPGQGRYWLDRYLSERGDANIRSTGDLIEKANFYDDPNFPDHRARHESALEQHELDMVARMQNRFAAQTMVMACMAELELDAVVYPTSNIPPVKLGSPRGPEINGRAGDGVWRFLGRNGFPAITVPVGFTTVMYDRIRVPSTPESASSDEDSETEIVGPVPARLPVGMDIIARPFGEPTILRIAAAYEAATRHREPPADFGPLSGEP